MENDWLISGHATLEREKRISTQTIQIGALENRIRRLAEIAEFTQFTSVPAGRGPHMWQRGEWVEV